MAYHRLAWNILSLSSDVIPVEGWQVQLIAWIFVCWQWRDLMTTLIQKWNNLGVLRKWKVVEEDTIGPSLREIVEQYIDERWPSDKKSDSFHGDSTIKKKDDAIDSLHKDVGVSSSSSTKEVEKTSESLPERNMTTIFSAEGTEGDDYLKEVL
ncbi:uncharacterized protein LOC131874800 [Cryptomeria japonica]|uniref:uncharacterized protein LOC131874800 n=1 Tax=Cryptomeria japonica TaxID=3369 RepID=UPI0027D9F58D|nr:uncharacterized protein LOC131874800 [Cryptomeria japonica]